MSDLTPHQGLVAALIVGVFAIAFSSQVSVVRAPTMLPPAASSLAVLPPTITLPPLTLPSFEPRQSEVATPAPAPSEAPPARVPTAQAAPATAPKEVAPPPTTPAATATVVPVAATVLPISATTLSSDHVSAELHGALVNILCVGVIGRGSPRLISGSGVFINPKGIILTNAHVAQYFLLDNRGIDCAIRTGEPATVSYTAALIFISGAWLTANPGVITETLPTGTGEYDFALLAVTDSATKSPLPATFPAVSLATTPPAVGTPIVIASYGSQFLNQNQLRSALLQTFVFSSVKDVLTFGTNTVDVLALGGSSAAQEGSSGGGIIDASGTLIGIITTSTVKGATSTRSLNAVTASYIRAEYARETGHSIERLLTKPVAEAVTDFAPQIPALEAIITANLK